MKKRNIAEMKPVIEELKNIESKLREILKNNAGLFNNIIEGILLLDKEDPETGHIVRRGMIERLVRDEYSDLRTNEEYEEKDKILYAIYKLYNFVKGKDRLVVTALERAMQKEGAEYYQQYREIIEKKIIEIFYPSDIEVSNNDQNSELIGESE